MRPEQLLWIRESTIKQYKLHENTIQFALKLLLGMVMLGLINTSGAYRPELAFLFEGFLGLLFYLAVAVLFAVFPPTLGNGLLLLILMAQLSNAVGVAFFACILLFCVLAFYGRVAPKKSYIILIMIVAHKLNMPFAVALFAGLYLGIPSIIPIVLGTCISSFLPFFAQLTETQKNAGAVELIELPSAIMGAYTEIFTHMSSHLDWIIWAFVLTMVTLAVHAISRMAIAHAKNIALCIGAVAAILGITIAGSIAGIGFSILGIIFGTLASLLLVLLLRCFDSIQDYRRAEQVQFEDEDNYYYVKVVPKILNGLEDYPSAPGKNKNKDKTKNQAKPNPKTKPKTKATPQPEPPMRDRDRGNGEQTLNLPLKRNLQNTKGKPNPNTRPNADSRGRVSSETRAYKAPRDTAPQRLPRQDQSQNPRDGQPRGSRKPNNNNPNNQ